MLPCPPRAPWCHLGHLTGAAQHCPERFWGVSVGLFDPERVLWGGGCGVVPCWDLTQFGGSGVGSGCPPGCPLSPVLPRQDNLQLHLKSTNGPIEVYLCPEEIPEDSPTKQHDVPPATTTPPPQDSSTHPSLQNNPEPPGASPQPLHGHRAPSLSPSLPLSSPGGPGSLLEVGTGLLGSPQHLLQQTEDQLPCAPSYLDSGPFVTFSPPLEQDDYLWGLEDGEGVSDLFEAYDLGELLKN